MKEAWVVDYRDQRGERHLKTFARKKEAEAGELWLKACTAAGLERSTLDQYDTHLRLHIVPMIGKVKLAQLNLPTVRNFEDRLAENGSSAIMIGKIVR